MNKPIGWSSFKQFSKDTQTEYIQGIIDTYDVTMTQIAEMFGVHGVTLRKYVSAELPGIRPKRKGGKLPPEIQEGWDRFIAGEPEEPEPQTEMLTDDVDEPVSPESEPADRSECGSEETAHEPSDKNNTMTMSRFAMQFCGELDMDDICNSLKFILGARRGTLNITFELEKRAAL